MVLSGLNFKIRSNATRVVRLGKLLNRKDFFIL